jgi:hypothetical protein
MRFMKIFTLVVFTFFGVSAYSASAPGPMPVLPGDTASIKLPIKITPAYVERLTGKKLNFFQRLELKLLQKKIRKQIDDPELVAKSLRDGRRSLIFGILAIGLLFIPLLGILGIASAVLALVFGIKSLKYQSNANAIIGTVLGGLVLLLFLIVIAVLVAFAPIF